MEPTTVSSATASSPPIPLRLTQCPHTWRFVPPLFTRATSCDYCSNLIYLWEGRYPYCQQCCANLHNSCWDALKKKTAAIAIVDECEGDLMRQLGAMDDCDNDEDNEGFGGATLKRHKVRDIDTETAAQDGANNHSAFSSRGPSSANFVGGNCVNSGLCDALGFASLSDETIAVQSGQHEGKKGNSNVAVVPQASLLPQPTASADSQEKDTSSASALFNRSASTSTPTSTLLSNTLTRAADTNITHGFRHTVHELIELSIAIAPNKLCAHCGTVAIGMGGSVLECSGCHYVVHRSCLGEVDRSTYLLEDETDRHARLQIAAIKKNILLGDTLEVMKGLHTRNPKWNRMLVSPLLMKRLVDSHRARYVALCAELAADAARSGIFVGSGLGRGLGDGGEGYAGVGSVFDGCERGDGAMGLMAAEGSNSKKGETSNSMDASPTTSATIGQLRPPLTILELEESMYALRFATASYGECYRTNYMSSVVGGFLMRVVARDLLEPKEEVTNKAVMDILGLPREQLLYARWSSQVLEPSYCVIFDRRVKTLFIVFRGSLSDADFLSDALGHGVVYDSVEDGAFGPGTDKTAPCGCNCENNTPCDCCGGDATKTPPSPSYTHHGMLKMMLTAYRDEVFIQTVKRFLVLHSDYKLVITGHSLGAGLACLFTVKVLAEMPFGECCRRVGSSAPSASPPALDIRTFAFAPPPVMSFPLAARYDEYIYSFVCGDDMVCRLQMNSIDRLTSQIEVVTNGIVSPESAVVSSTSRVVLPTATAPTAQSTATTSEHDDYCVLEPMIPSVEEAHVEDGASPLSTLGAAAAAEEGPLSNFFSIAAEPSPPPPPREDANVELQIVGRVFLMTHPEAVHTNPSGRGTSVGSTVTGAVGGAGSAISTFFGLHSYKKDEVATNEGSASLVNDTSAGVRSRSSSHVTSSNFFRTLVSTAANTMLASSPRADGTDTISDSDAVSNGPQPLPARLLRNRLLPVTRDHPVLHHIFVGPDAVQNHLMDVYQDNLSYCMRTQVRPLGV